MEVVKDVELITCGRMVCCRSEGYDLLGPGLLGHVLLRPTGFPSLLRPVLLWPILLRTVLLRPGLLLLIFFCFFFFSSILYFFRLASSSFCSSSIFFCEPQTPKPPNPQTLKHLKPKPYTPKFPPFDLQQTFMWSIAGRRPAMLHMKAC